MIILCCYAILYHHIHILIVFLCYVMLFVMYQSVLILPLCIVSKFFCSS